MSKPIDKNEWQPVEGNITTPWAADVSPDTSLPEYPRPQMIRDRWLNLNGLWDYAVRPKYMDKIDNYDGSILVPYPVESALSGVKRQLLPEELLWYRRYFTVPDEWNGQKLLLHFGAVDWKAIVYINGIKIGEHNGGYTPFTFDVSHLIHEGGNEIVVSVWDPTDEFEQQRGKQTLKPGGIFYTPISGIWQTVWLEPVPRTYINSFKLLPDIDNETLSIECTACGDMEDIIIEAAAFDDTTCSGAEISYTKGDLGSKLELNIRSPKLWSPESPFLYGLKIRLIRGGEILDETGSYFGMRKISTERDENGRTIVLLNNKPIFQSGLLDQGYWPDGLYTAPNDDALRYDIDTAKKMGYNMLRKHIKVEPARWYYYCDVIGMLVWQDMPNGGSAFNVLNHIVMPLLGIGKKDNTAHSYGIFGRSDADNREQYKNELIEMIDALHNSPSIITWVPFNEGWGQFDAAEISSWVKAYDPSRLVDHASGWYDQNCGDFCSIHTYIRKLRSRPANGRVFAVSEFGGYGLMEKDHVWRQDKKMSYKGYKSAGELSAAYTSLMDSQVMPLISDGLCACVYTQLTDVETEVNGIMTYDRKVIKIDSSTIYDINMKLYRSFEELLRI